MIPTNTPEDRNYDPDSSFLLWTDDELRTAVSRCKDERWYDLAEKYSNELDRRKLQEILPER
jgi:hypothetical protein